MDWLPGNTPSVATLVATGLASVVLNLESMLNFVNLRADVRESDSPSCIQLTDGAYYRSIYRFTLW